MDRPDEPPPPLRAVVYVSSAVRLLGEPELEALLLDSREFNARHAISGVLLYGDGNFFQYLEGAPADVDAVYTRVRRSRLHVDLIELMDEPIAARAFAGWTMGFSRAPRSTLLALADAAWRNEQSGQAARQPVHSDGLALLDNFCRSNRVF